jgi:hypothetical protein
MRKATQLLIVASLLSIGFGFYIGNTSNAVAGMMLFCVASLFFMTIGPSHERWKEEKEEELKKLDEDFDMTYDAEPYYEEFPLGKK